jgi:hypothetical protein
MKYRRFRTADGAFLDALFTTEGGFATPAEAQVADLEAGYGVSGLTVVEGDGDPWDGVSELIVGRVQDVPLDPDNDLSAAISAATTLAELKQALIGQKSGAAVKGRPVE